MARNTVLVEAAGPVLEKASKAISATLTPGMLVTYASGGVSRHGAAGPVHPIVFVRENRERDGHGITDAILQNDSCTVIYPKPGDVVNAVAVTGATINRGDPLTCAANGALDVAGSGDAIVGTAEEDAADNRVLCRIGAADRQYSL